MHRTQIYFDEPLFTAIKQQASRLNISVSAYIRETLKKEVSRQQVKSEPIDFSEFAGMWEGRDISQESLREKAWK